MGVIEGVLVIKKRISQFLCIFCIKILLCINCAALVHAGSSGYQKNAPSGLMHWLYQKFTTQPIENMQNDANKNSTICTKNEKISHTNEKRESIDEESESSTDAESELTDIETTDIATTDIETTDIETTDIEEHGRAKNDKKNVESNEDTKEHEIMNEEDAKEKVSRCRTACGGLLKGVIYSTAIVTFTLFTAQAIGFDVTPLTTPLESFKDYCVEKVYEITPPLLGNLSLFASLKEGSVAIWNPGTVNSDKGGYMHHRGYADVINFSRPEYLVSKKLFSSICELTCLSSEDNCYPIVGLWTDNKDQQLCSLDTHVCPLLKDNSGGKPSCNVHTSCWLSARLSEELISSEGQKRRFVIEIAPEARSYGNHKQLAITCATEYAIEHQLLSDHSKKNMIKETRNQKLLKKCNHALNRYILFDTFGINQKNYFLVYEKFIHARKPGVTHTPRSLMITKYTRNDSSPQYEEHQLTYEKINAQLQLPAVSPEVEFYDANYTFRYVAYKKPGASGIVIAVFPLPSEKYNDEMLGGKKARYIAATVNVPGKPLLITENDLWVLQDGEHVKHYSFSVSAQKIIIGARSKCVLDFSDSSHVDQPIIFAAEFNKKIYTFRHRSFGGRHLVNGKLVVERYDMKHCSYDDEWEAEASLPRLKFDTALRYHIVMPATSGDALQFQIYPISELAFCSKHHDSVDELASENSVLHLPVLDTDKKMYPFIHLGLLDQNK